MKQLPFFIRRAYPFESTVGIIASLARFNGVNPVDVMRWLEIRSAGNVHKLFYLPERVASALPSSRAHDYRMHFPSAFRLAPFSATMVVRYCPECLVWGYHSTFFCLPQVETCLIHNAPLKPLCKWCHSMLSRDLLDAPCSQCGFYVCQALNQVKYRCSPAIALKTYRAGKALAAWFTFVRSGAQSGSPFFIKLDKIGSYTEDPIDKVLITSLGCPIAKNDGVVRRLTKIVNWEVPSNRRHWKDWQGACRNIETVHLQRHEYCLAHCEGLLGYWDGVKAPRPTCLKAAIYLLIRLRLAITSSVPWLPSKLDCLGFGYIDALQQSTFIDQEIPVVLVKVYYLKLLYDASIYLELGYVIKFRVRTWQGLLHELAAPAGISMRRETVLGVVSEKMLRCPHVRRVVNTPHLYICRDSDSSWTLSLACSGTQQVIMDL